MKKVMIDKEQMLDNLIRKFGFEHSAVIDFATIMYDKNFNEKMVADVYRGLIEAWGKDRQIAQLLLYNLPIDYFKKIAYNKDR